MYKDMTSAKQQPVKERSVLIWLMATRPQFFSAIILSVLLGAAVAWHETRQLNWELLILSLAAAVLLHAGANVLNDYFDFRSGVDNLNPQPLTPFAGGSRMIQRGVITERETLRFGIILLIGGTVLGLLLMAMTGPLLLVIGFIGVLSAVIYSCPPMALNYRGFGELLIGLNFGVLPVAGSFYVQTLTLSRGVVLAALPVALLAAAILYINQFPDYAYDRQCGKKTAIVSLGPRRAASGYFFLPASAYLVIVVGMLTALMPNLVWMALLTAPLAALAAAKLSTAYDDDVAIRTPIKATIAIHALTSALLIAAYVRAG